jgi:hypothetical protein
MARPQCGQCSHDGYLESGGRAWAVLAGSDLGGEPAISRSLGTLSSASDKSKEPSSPTLMYSVLPEASSA